MNAYYLELKNVLRLDACYPIGSHCFCWVMFVRSQKIFFSVAAIKFHSFVFISDPGHHWFGYMLWDPLFIFRGKCLFSTDMILIAVMLNWIVFRLNLVKVKKYFKFFTIKSHSFLYNLGFDLHLLESLL